MAISILFFCCCCFLLRPSEAMSHAFLPLKLLETSLAAASPTKLAYHNGPLLSAPNPINIYILWYGTFSATQKPIVSDFFSSFSSPSSAPSVQSWWKTTSLYTDTSHSPISSSVLLKSQTSDAYSLGKTLTKPQIATLVQNAIAGGTFPADGRGIYLVLSSDDVYVEDFCMSSCGFHDHGAAGKQELIYGWVGNAAKQCPGQCAWPFEAPQFGPPTKLEAPNGDIGMDGMIINIATILAGAATNPLENGYYQGDPRVPAEAVSACTGIFGNGAYPGYPGLLLTDKKTGASYNANGANNRLFLLPGMWDPLTQSCTTLS